MKQRLLLALLVLFASVGMVRAADGEVAVKSNGTGPVTITFMGAAITAHTPSGADVQMSTDKKKITIAQGYTTEVVLTAAGATNIAFTGNMEALKIENNTLKSVSLKGCYVKELTIESSSTALTSLDCCGLGLEDLALTIPHLTDLNASDNKLTDGHLKYLPASLTKLNISKNGIETFDPTAVPAEAAGTAIPLSNLTDLDVSSNKLDEINVKGTTLPNLARLNLSGNKIKSFGASQSPVSSCTVTWGVQTLTASSTASPANKGINIKKLIQDVLSFEPATYSGVSWKVKDGNVYVADPNTAHLQSPTYPDEYRFYNNTSKIFVSGTYQCTVTVNGRTYNIEGITVQPAEFAFSWIHPAHASKLTVTKNGVDFLESMPSSNPAPGKVSQGDVLLFSTTMADGYDQVVYSTEGLRPAGGLTEPYAYNPFQCTVEGKYVNVGTSIEPKMSAVVSGANHVVTYEASDITKGGTFTVEKELTDGTKVALKNRAEIATGDKLVVTLLPSLSYAGSLYINNADKTTDLNSQKVYAYTVKNTDKDFNIAVTFIKDQIKIQGKVDGEDLKSSMTIAYIKSKKMVVDGTTDVSGASDVYIAKNTDHQLQFTIDQAATGGDGRILDVITINGGDKKSITSSTNGKEITYTVSFAVKEDDIIVSIKTKKVASVTINLVKNAKTASSVSANDKQVQMYTGASLPLLFTTTPAGLENRVVVKYEKGGVALGTTAPVAVGDYTASLTFKETADYVLTTPAADVADFAYSITPASLSIQTLPKITVNKEGKYEITGGKVMFGKTEIAGLFKPQGISGSISSPQTGNIGKSHNVEVKFTPSAAADKVNFASAAATVLVEVPGSVVNKIKTSIYTPLPAGITLELYNGDKLINPATESFIDGTKLTGVVTYPVGTRNVALAPTSELLGTTVTPNDAATTEGKKVYDIVLKGTTQFKVTADGTNAYTVKLQKQTVEYDGETQAYDITTGGLQIFDKVGPAPAAVSAILTYKDKAGNTIPLPVNAGEYTVCVRINADETTGYVEFYDEFPGVLVITKTRAMVYKWPVASKIAKGMPLSQSALSGGAASIPGTFAWEDETTVPPLEGGKYKAIFIPAAEYALNHEKVVTPSGTAEDGGLENDHRIRVEISDLQIVTFAPKNGKLAVTNQHGTSLESGNAVSKGDVLTITATPEEGFELKSLTVNGSASSASYTVGESSVSIVAVFQVKTIVDPNTQYTVTLPKADAVRGLIINKAGVNAVAKNGAFSFTLQSLAADAKNIVVKVDGIVLAPASDGTYSIAKVDGNKTITVALSNPTKIKVAVEQETKNAKGYLMGTVEVLEGLAADNTCYFGDEVTLVAFPESGVSFGGWTGSIGGTEKLATFTVKQAMTIKPRFTGVPTGIDAIEATSVRGLQGQILVSCDGDATVTLIGMDGTHKVVRISGDTYIPATTGVYGIIVAQNGAEVIKTKLIVR